jgi:hypothetical protein
MAKQANAAEARVGVGQAFPESRGRGALEDAREEDAREMEARGRMLTEYGALRRRLAALMGDASSLGAEFQELSNQLRMCPNVVSLEGLIAPNSTRAPFAQSLFDTARLAELVAEIRATIERKNEIQEQLREIGVLDAFGQLRY